MTLALARFRPRERPSAGAGPVVDTPAGRVGAWRLLASMPAVRLVKCAFAVANFFTAPVLLVIPLYAKGVLAGSGATMATLEAALWFGLLAGAFSGGTIKVPTSRVTQFGAASVAVNALALALPGVLATFPVYAVTLALGGWCVGVVNVRFVAFFHEVVPPAVKGRFFAAMQGLVAVAYPASCAVFGVLGDTVSPRVLCVVQGSGLVIVAIGLVAVRTAGPTGPRRSGSLARGD